MNNIIDEARAIFDGAETSQEVRDVIEWFAGRLTASVDLKDVHCVTIAARPTPEAAINAAPQLAADCARCNGSGESTGHEGLGPYSREVDVPCPSCDGTGFADKLPTLWSVWKHRNGIEYRVTNLVNMESARPEYPPTVVYENCANGKLWARPLRDWHRSMTRMAD